MTAEERLDNLEKRVTDIEKRIQCQPKGINCQDVADRLQKALLEQIKPIQQKPKDFH